MSAPLIRTEFASSLAESVPGRKARGWLCREAWDTPGSNIAQEISYRCFERVRSLSVIISYRRIYAILKGQQRLLSKEMTCFTPTKGDRVRIDIPDETDPDYRLHGMHGRVEAIIEDDAGKETGEDLDSAIYRIHTDEGDTVDVRSRDLRPPIEQ